MPASSHPASYPNQNSYAYGDSESDQRAVLDLAGHPVQSDVAELGGFVAKKHGLVASQAPAVRAIRSSSFSRARTRPSMAETLVANAVGRW